MAEKEWDPKPKRERPKKEGNSKISAGIRIVVFNLLALALYTGFCAIYEDGGVVLDVIFLFVQTALCITLAIANKKWAWAISALLVLAIGVPVCLLVLSRLQ